MGIEDKTLKESKVGKVLDGLNTLRQTVETLAKTLDEHGVQKPPQGSVSPKTSGEPKPTTLWLLNTLPEKIEEIKEDINTQINRLRELF